MNTVLIVDDDPGTLQLIWKVMQRAGMTPLMATNASEGLRKARAYHPDIVITDYVMPTMTGSDLSQVIKRAPDLCDIKVVIYSALPDIEQVCKNSDADLIIKKPCLPDELVRVVIQLLPSAENSYIPIAKKRETAPLHLNKQIS